MSHTGTLSSYARKCGKTPGRAAQDGSTALNHSRSTLPCKAPASHRQRIGAHEGQAVSVDGISSGLRRAAPCPSHGRQGAFQPTRPALDAARVPDRRNVRCHQLSRNRLLMSHARSPCNGRPGWPPAPKDGRQRRASQSPTSRRYTSDIPVSSARLGEVFSQPPEQDELSRRYPNVATGMLPTS
jgi:hypothetical protein